MTSFPFFLLLRTKLWNSRISFVLVSIISFFSSTNDEEIANAIRSINRGKSADYHGLTIEHIINAGKDMEKLFLLITNEIFRQGRVPETLNYFIECCFGVKEYDLAVSVIIYNLSVAFFHWQGWVYSQYKSIQALYQPITKKARGNKHWIENRKHKYFFHCQGWINWWWTTCESPLSSALYF
jgi:hypothetical protein